MDWKKDLAFTAIVTLASQTLDVLVHLAGDIAVHIPYVAVKMTVIAFTLFFYAYWIGVSKKDGLISCMLASALFYVYYRFAEPTLDRTIFVLDEASIFIIIHWIAIVIPYLITSEYLLPQPRYSGLNLKSKTLYSTAGTGLALAALLMIPTRQVLKANGLNFGLSYNDHVLVGTLALILAIIALYKLLLTSKK